MYCSHINVNNDYSFWSYDKTLCGCTAVILMLIMTIVSGHMIKLCADVLQPYNVSIYCMPIFVITVYITTTISFFGSEKIAINQHIIAFDIILRIQEILTCDTLWTFIHFSSSQYILYNRYSLSESLVNLQIFWNNICLQKIKEKCLFYRMRQVKTYMYIIYMYIYFLNQKCNWNKILKYAQVSDPIV